MNMLKIQRRRLRSRPQTILTAALTVVSFYCLLLRGSRARVGYSGGGIKVGDSVPEAGTDPHEEFQREGEVDLEIPFQETQEDYLREVYLQEWEERGRNPGAGAIYGNTLATLTNKENRRPAMEGALKDSGRKTSYSIDRPYFFNPYPKYNTEAWRDARHADYVPCVGANGALAEDISVFKGSPHDFPVPGFGSFELLGLDGNLCFERETRLGPYGLTHQVDQNNQPVDWENTPWGELQRTCVDRNKARFEMEGPPNKYVTSAYGPISDPGPEEPGAQEVARRDVAKGSQRGREPKAHRRWLTLNHHDGEGEIAKEPRTAVLLRSYTGKEYNENDKEVIRSLVTELSLRSGGEYEVFLFVQVKGPERIFDNNTEYEMVLQMDIPREFWDMTVLWNDEKAHAAYPRMEPNVEASVHNAQWLSVQQFMQENRQFDYVWNWEMDSRVTGHHYDMLSKLGEFAAKQPRKGLWERSERFYIPSYHGGYETDFRVQVEKLAGSNSVWGPPLLPFINPVGPAPPLRTPADDKYEWGVGEPADLITLSPIFDTNNSGWVLLDHVWGYNDANHDTHALPRRASIITQSRVSRRLIDIMHVENLRGNHVASEMTPATVAYLHGLKAVYAPIPVFFDRPWEAHKLARWFNGGPKGQSGSFGSAMGWGREGRFQGTTWYFRAEPPQRLYNNWMGYEDTGIGGAKWEEVHGQPCLPAMFLHPIKVVEPTEPGHSSESRLPY